MPAKPKFRQCSGLVNDVVDDAMSEIEMLAEEMRSWADNMEEKLSHTDKYASVSQVADTLESVSRPDADAFDLIACVWTEQDKRNMPRHMRLSNAVAALEAAETALRESGRRLEDNVKKATAGDEPEDATPEDGALDSAADMETAANEIREVIDAVEGVEFPGMF